MAIVFNTGKETLEIDRCVPDKDVPNGYKIRGRLLTERSRDPLTSVPEALMVIFGDSPITDSRIDTNLRKFLLRRTQTVRFSAGFSPDRVRLQAFPRPSPEEPRVVKMVRFLTGVVLETLRTDRIDLVKQQQIAELARQAQAAGIMQSNELLKKSFDWGGDGLPSGLVVENDGRTVFDILINQRLISK